MPGWNGVTVFPGVGDNLTFMLEIVPKLSPNFKHYKKSNKIVAERVGFEPTVVLPTHAFQACALNHSAISPYHLFTTLC